MSEEVPFNLQWETLGSEGEAEAIRLVTEAIKGANADPANYLIAMRYLDTLQEMTSGKDNKVIYMPYEATGVLSSLGGITAEGALGLVGVYGQCEGAFEVHLAQLLHVPGGEDAAGQPTARVEVYDPRAGRWQRADPAPFFRSGSLPHRAIRPTRRRAIFAAWLHHEQHADRSAG